MRQLNNYLHLVFVSDSSMYLLYLQIKDGIGNILLLSNVLTVEFVRIPPHFEYKIYSDF